LPADDSWLPSFGVDVLQKIATEPLVYLFKQFSRRLQIDACGTDMHMPHIGGKRREPGVDIHTPPVPVQQSVYGEGMPLMPSSA